MPKLSPSYLQVSDLLSTCTGSPTPQKLQRMGNSKENMNDNMSHKMQRYLQAELDKIELPRETIYMIDKVVRQRVKRGPFGMENSELIADQHDREVFEKNDRNQRLVEGMSSHSRINNTAVDAAKEADISSDGAVRRINSV